MSPLPIVTTSANLDLFLCLLRLCGLLERGRTGDSHLIFLYCFVSRSIIVV